MQEEKKCRFGHECTSRCMNDIECPCQSEHCCALTENCEGCDDHYEKPCEFCGGTGEISEDSQDSSGNWERGVETRKCICRLDLSGEDNNKQE